MGANWVDGEGKREEVDKEEYDIVSGSRFSGTKSRLRESIYTYSWLAMTFSKRNHKAGLTHYAAVVEEKRTRCRYKVKSDRSRFLLR